MRIVECQQYSKEWWAAHRGRPSGSNFDKIITPKTCEISKSATDYACELIAQMYDPMYGEVEGYVTAAMRNGTIMEPEARRYYEFERNCDVQQVGLCETDCGRFICSPDALVGEDGVLELKSPGYKTQIKYLLQGTLPDEYRCQCHGHMLVTSRAYCDFMSYVVGLPPLLIRVEPDEFTLKLAEALEIFWKSFTELKARIMGAGDPVAATREPFVSPF